MTETRTWTLPAEGRRVGLIGKGGSGKSTIAAHLLAWWARRGVEAVGVDMDIPGDDEHGSLYAWASLTDVGAPVYPAPAHTRLAQESQRLTPAGGLGLLDTGAWHRKAGGPHYSVLSAVDLAVLTLQPTEMELERAGSVLTALEHLESVGAHVPDFVILLTMVNNSAASPAETREALTSNGYRVLTTEVPRQDSRQGYAQAFGKPPRLIIGDAMDSLSVELLEAITR
ncbi:ParA family protein [Actinomadura sp. 6N118]|uniref:ParA family protein n=1 Tax=Actinomadura sp. 6N118 TaxID=3375151 RepID=UPI0037A212FD